MQRKSGIDLIRCIGFLFVVMFHFYLYNYFYYVPQTGFWVLTADCFRTLSLTCNGLFMMLTGYLYCEKDLSVRYFQRLPGVWLAYYIAAAVSIPVRHFLLEDEQTLSEWCRRFFGFSGVYYGWYVEMYIGLMLISPLLNAAVNELEKKDKLLPAVLLCAAAVSLAQFPPCGILPDWWKSFYPVTYYLIGACVRKKHPELKKLPLVAAVLAVTVGTACATFFSTDEKLQSGYYPEFGNIEIMLIGVCLFLCLYNVQLRNRPSKLIAFLAKGTFGGYLLSNLLDRWVYKALRAWCTPSKYPLLFLCAGVPVFFVSIFAGRFLSRVTEHLCQLTGKAVRKLFIIFRKLLAL